MSLRKHSKKLVAGAIAVAVSAGGGYQVYDNSRRANLKSKLATSQLKMLDRSERLSKRQLKNRERFIELIQK